jgi:hypothetical protein
MGLQQFSAMLSTQSSASSQLSRVVRKKNMVMSPVGPRKRNDFAGEDQQQFTNQPTSQSQE